MYWGKITSIDDQQVTLDLECAGKTRKFNWKQLEGVNFSPSCAPATWAAMGELDLGCQRGKKPRSLFIVDTKDEQALVSENILLGADRITLRLVHNKHRAYDRKVDSLNVMRVTGCF